jgi:hypothetical protein
MNDECGMMNVKEGAASHSSLIVPHSSLFSYAVRVCAGHQ